MRLSRFFAGFLTLSLVSGIVLGDLMHGLGNVAQRESSHASDHVDAADSHGDEYAIEGDTNNGGCHLRKSNDTLASHGGQRTSGSDVIGIAPHVFGKVSSCLLAAIDEFTGRKVPLFEHASVFAATISMRV